jgi:hypothetical protein
MPFARGFFALAFFARYPLRAIEKAEDYPTRFVAMSLFIDKPVRSLFHRPGHSARRMGPGFRETTMTL